MAVVEADLKRVEPCRSRLDDLAVLDEMASDESDEDVAD